jgi:radical SAM/Cys-rich protein
LTTASERILEESLRVLADPSSGPRPVRSLRVRGNPLAETAEQRRVLAGWAAEDPATADFASRVQALDPGLLRPAPLEIFQVNLGKLCNMSCRHCHVDAGPDRSDAMMDEATVDAVVAAMARSGAHTLDLTGGAPELHPAFRRLVAAARSQGMHVIDRCNLTILLVRRFEDLPEFLAAHEVEVVASLPHVRAMNTDAQRGDGTWQKSIEAMRRLNAAGYGQGDPSRRLTLVSNPSGAFLGAGQATLEAEWKRELALRHGVQFDRLFVLNNMPISRFLEWLVESGNFAAYMEKIVQAFNPAAVPGVMCRNTISVGWDGLLYDCDFNQMLDMAADVKAPHVRDFDLAAWQARIIRTDRHCFGCTAGAGSSCGGQTA